MYPRRAILLTTRCLEISRKKTSEDSSGYSGSEMERQTVLGYLSRTKKSIKIDHADCQKIQLTYSIFKIEAMKFLSFD